MNREELDIDTRNPSKGGSDERSKIAKLGHRVKASLGEAANRFGPGARKRPRTDQPANPLETKLGEREETRGRYIQSFLDERARKDMEADLASASSDELLVTLREAITSNEINDAVAAANVLTARGQTYIGMAAQELIAVAGDALAGSCEAEIVAVVIRQNSGEFSRVSPGLALWAGIDNIDEAPEEVTLNDVVKNADTYAGASPEEMANWSIDTIKAAYAATYEAGGAALSDLQEQARILIDSQREYVNRLYYSVLQAYRVIASGRRLY